jgi:hypothetical protein
MALGTVRIQGARNEVGCRVGAQATEALVPRAFEVLNALLKSIGVRDCPL